MEQTLEKDKSVENLRIFLRPIKYSLIELFVSCARVFFFWLPGGDVAKGQALFVLHFLGGCILYSVYFILPSKHPLRLFIFLFYVIVVLQIIVFRGCVITKAEQKLTGANDTVMDSWIRLVGYEPTRESRIVCSIGVLGSMSMTLLMNTIIEQII